jgi:hypothetical protein
MRRGWREAPALKWIRSTARASVILFGVSTAFPVAAALTNTKAPSRALGVLDVMVAALLVAVAITVAGKHRGTVSDADRLDAFRVSQTLFMSIPALLLVFLLVGNRIDWQVLVVGVAWRGWLLMYTLPYMISALRRTESS